MRKTLSFPGLCNLSMVAGKLVFETEIEQDFYESEIPNYNQAPTLRFLGSDFNSFFINEEIVATDILATEIFRILILYSPQPLKKDHLMSLVSRKYKEVGLVKRGPNKGYPRNFKIINCLERSGLLNRENQQKSPILCVRKGFFVINSAFSLEVIENGKKLARNLSRIS